MVIEVSQSFVYPSKPAEYWLIDSVNTAKPIEFLRISMDFIN